MKKIVLHGAINTSNFGDVLFASMFFNYLNDIPDKYDVYFAEFPHYGVGSFVRKELPYNKHISLLGQLKSDVLVYISGGYLGDNKKSIRLSIRRFVRYILPGLLAVLTKKRIYILGAGGGPLYSPINRWGFKYIMNKAELITVRDEETKHYFEKLGVRTKIKATADTALAISKSMIPELSILDKEKYVLKTNGKKKLFIHIVQLKSVDMQFAKRIVPAINLFLKKHPEYCVIVGSDLEISDISQLETIKVLDYTDYYHYKYKSAWQLCSLLQDVDLIVTPKLHVGIIGSSLGKSVISFPEHAYKTERFYASIQEADRCRKLDITTSEEAYNIMEKYSETPITVNKKIRNLAVSNLLYLNDI